MRADASASSCERAWPPEVLRITFGIVWAIDAALKWLPGFHNTFMGVIMGEESGQPHWLRPWFSWWVDLQHHRANFFVYLTASVETLIALALILGFARKYTYVAAGLFSLVVWATAEGFGGPYTVGASDIGTAVIYAIVFANLLAMSYYAGPGRCSVDYYLERRYAWWWHVAEVRQPPHPTTVPEEGALVPV